MQPYYIVTTTENLPYTPNFFYRTTPLPPRKSFPNATTHYRISIHLLDLPQDIIHSNLCQPITSQPKESRRWHRNHPTYPHILSQIPTPCLISDLCGRTQSTDLCCSQESSRSVPHHSERSSTQYTCTDSQISSTRRDCSPWAIGADSSHVLHSQHNDAMAALLLMRIMQSQHVCCAYSNQRLPRQKTLHNYTVTKNFT